eukprot:scaffold2825_cov111-Isochrysis_galbana.AAC.13
MKWSVDGAAAPGRWSSEAGHEPGGSWYAARRPRRRRPGASREALSHSGDAPTAASAAPPSCNAVRGLASGDPVLLGLGTTAACGMADVRSGKTPRTRKAPRRPPPTAAAARRAAVSPSKSSRASSRMASLAAARSARRSGSHSMPTRPVRLPPDDRTADRTTPSEHCTWLRWRHHGSAASSSAGAADVGPPLSASAAAYASRTAEAGAPTAAAAAAASSSYRTISLNRRVGGPVAGVRIRSMCR